MVCDSLVSHTLILFIPLISYQIIILIFVPSKIIALFLKSRMVVATLLISNRNIFLKHLTFFCDFANISEYLKFLM
jgi:hypothetical protein